MTSQPTTRGRVVAAANPHYDHLPVQAPSVPSKNLQPDDRPAIDLALQDRFERSGRFV